MNEQSINEELDFNIAVDKYIETLTENDSLLVLAQRFHKGIAHTILAGDTINLSAIMADKKCIDIHTQEQKETHNALQEAIVEIALNICVNNKKLKKQFLKRLNQK